MINPETRRVIEVCVNGTWQPTNLGELDSGDIIRMFNPDGSPVVCQETGAISWTVLEQPKIMVDPILPEVTEPVEVIKTSTDIPFLSNKITDIES